MGVWQDARGLASSANAAAKTPGVGHKSLVWKPWARRGANPGEWMRGTYKLQDDEQQVVHNKGPLAAVAVGRNTKGDGADGAEHEHQRDSPGDVRIGLLERLGEILDRQRDGEEVKGVPRLSSGPVVSPPAPASCLAGSPCFLRLTQAQKATAKKFHWRRVIIRSNRMGLGGRAMTGWSVEIRVAQYFPMLMPTCHQRLARMGALPGRERVGSPYRDGGGAGWSLPSRHRGVFPGHGTGPMAPRVSLRPPW